MSELDLSAAVKLEAIGMLSAVVRLLAGTKIDQQRVGQTARESQSSLADYLAQVVAAGTTHTWPPR
jgi:hypothetical protein